MERMKVTIPVEVSEGDAGLFYATSPLVNGLLAVGKTESEALANIERCMFNLTVMADNEHLA